MMIMLERVFGAMVGRDHDDHDNHDDNDFHDDHDDFLERVFGAMVAMVGRAAQGIT